MEVLHQGAASRCRAQVYQEPAAPAAAYHACARDSRGHRLQAAGYDSGNQRNPWGERRRCHKDAARKTVDHDGGAEEGDWAADSLSHLKTVPDAFWPFRFGRAAQLERI